MLRRSARSRLQLGLASLACLAVVLSGCTISIEGKARRVGAVIDPGKVAGLKVSDGPSGRKPNAKPADISVDNLEPAEDTPGASKPELEQQQLRRHMDLLAKDAVADVQEYWAEYFPKTFNGKPYEPLKRVLSYDSAGKSIFVCHTSTRGFVNAFFCPPEDTVAWDRGKLLPLIYKKYGDISVVTILAHEVGHAVAYRGNITAANTPTIVAEQQADCFTGAFFRHMAEGKTAHFQVSTGDGLNKALQSLFMVRDPVGSSFTTEGAHGNAFDRISAFQFGFSQGPARCARIDKAEVQSRITELPFRPNTMNSSAGPGNLPIDEKHIMIIVDSLKQVFKDTGATPPNLLSGTEKCANTKITVPATYCPETNSISLEVARLAEIGAPANNTERSGTASGDFAAFAEIASRYVLSVQKAAGFDLDDDNAGLRTACLVGSWAGALLEHPFAKRNPVGTLRISPGDLDEAVSELLSPNSLIAADVNGSHVPSGFARVEAFRVGFMDGIPGCNDDFGSS